MADPLLTQIMDNMVAAIGQISPTNGYERTVRTTSRMSLMPAQPQYDAVFMAAVSEEKTDLAVQVKESKATISVLGIASDADDTVDAVHKLAADITKALHVDPTRGGLALDTRVVGIVYDISEEVAPLGACNLEVEVIYRHRLGDPYTAV